MKYGEAFAGFPLATTLVLASPVLGHAFPVFSLSGRQGNCRYLRLFIGCFSGTHAGVDICTVICVFSLVLRINPHFVRTIVTYISTLLMMICLPCSQEFVLGFVLISATVILRLHLSKEVRGKPEVKLFWMR